MINKQTITWLEIVERSYQLANMILQKYPHREFDTIVTVARGGFVPAAIISNYLNITNVITVHISSYHQTTHNDLDLLNLSGQQQYRTVVIDDLIDSGKAIKAIQQKIPAAVFATVYAKANSRQWVDLYTENIDADKWLVFPWEQIPIRCTNQLLTGNQSTQIKQVLEYHQTSGNSCFVG